MRTEEAEEYHSKDFDWEDLKNLVENDPSLSHHLDSRRLHESQDDRDSSSRIRIDSLAWQNFHARHSSGKFFKERRYLLKEFPELVSCGKNSKLLEVGCGNGSTVLPILRGSKNMTVYACDCSTEALIRTKENIDGSIAISGNFHSFCCDFSESAFPKWLACDSCRENYCCHLDTGESRTVPQQRMPRAVEECLSVLKPGGLLFFRDYGLYDMTMLRFQPEKQIGFREYMRSDGTLSYFFCLDTVRRLFAGAGFIEVELEYCCVRAVNRRKGKNMYRVWIHGKFQKPF